MNWAVAFHEDFVLESRGLDRRIQDEVYAVGRLRDRALVGVLMFSFARITTRRGSGLSSGSTRKEDGTTWCWRTIRRRLT